MAAGADSADWPHANGDDHSELANGGDHLVPSPGQNGNGLDHNDTGDFPVDCDVELGDLEADQDVAYDGISRDDIIKRLREIVGSTFISSHSGEMDSLSHMVWGLKVRQKQEAALQNIRDGKVALINGYCPPRAFGRLIWPCTSCGGDGHNGDQCPLKSGAAAATADLPEGGSAAGSANTRSAGDKKGTKKRSKRAAKEAEKATTADDGSSSMADQEDDGLAAEGDAAAVSDATPKVAEQHARVKSRTARAAPPQPAAQPEEAEEEDEEDGAAGGDDDLTSLVSAFAPLKGKAGAKSGLTLLPPPGLSPHRSGSADAADPASAPSSGAADAAAKDAEQPEQKEGAKRGRGRGAAGKKRGDSDSEQVVSVPADGRVASGARPGSSSGSQDTQQQQQQQQQQQRRARYADTECFRCGQTGHVKAECPNEPVDRGTNRRQQPQARQQQQQQQPLRHQQQQAAPVSPSRQGYSAMHDIHSALGHAPPPSGWESQPGAVHADSVWGVSAGRGDAGAGAGLPPGLQQQQHMLPREVAAGPDEDDDLSDLLGNLGVETAAPAAAPWGGAGQGWSNVAGAGPHPLHQPPPLTPAQERERQEQEELDAALKASMEDTRGFGGSPLHSEAQSGGRAVAGAGAGLANDTGEYNCFLNAIIQCVWRCRDFREGIVSLNPDELPDDEGNPRIVRELVQLFRAVDEQQRGDADPDETRAVISPNGLREALSHTAEFKLGEMNDAAEVLRMIYDALIDQGHRDMVTSCFGLDIHESVRCRHCDMETHALRYTQYFQQVPAAALRKVAEQDPDNALGYYLVAIDKQTRKTCDKDVGGCGRPNQVGHRVQGLAPKVFSIELAWQNNQETAEDIAETLSVVDLFLDPSQRYQALQPKRQRLVAMVCYYGQHYMAFVLVKPPGNASGPGEWLLLDDANATEVGDWDAVLDKCKAGRIQPSVLLYEDTQS